MPARASMRVERTFQVRGGNVVTLTVKVVREGASWIACEDVRGLVDGKKAYAIRKGATLVRRQDLDRDGRPFVMVFNDGIHDALRSQGLHVPDGYDAEDESVAMHRESLAFALQGIWYMSRVPTALQLGEYADAVASVGVPLARARDEDKVRAGSQARRAANLNDSLGRPNRHSRSPIVWSADRALSRRTATTRRIRPRVAWKNWELVALADEVWNAKRHFEGEVAQALRWWDPTVGILTADVAGRMATRLEKLAGSLRSVSIAPYSRRGFPRIAADLDLAVIMLRAGNYAGARKMLDRCRRAFVLMDARRTLEEARTVASRVAKARIVLSKADVGALVDTIDRVEATLVVDGLPIDGDFVNPVSARVIADLARARAAALGIEYRAREVHVALGAAAAPL